jgi:L-ascorbate metabolism protein UlaG (beta-lactamase superfamily)
MESTFHLTYAGHATVLIHMDGVQVLADPVLRDFVGPLRRQMAAPDLASWQVDAVLISHPHRDHLDVPSLRQLGYDMRLIVPRGAGGMLRQWGFRQVEEVVPGEVTTVGKVVVEATPANHTSSRSRFEPTVQCMGFIIQGSHRTYFAGDTDLFPEMARIGQDLDVALLPVWGWGPRLGNGHMDPLRAAESLPMLRPRVAIPIHWGTFCPIGTGWMQFLSHPPRAFAHYAADLAPEVEICILEPGQSFHAVFD